MQKLNKKIELADLDSWGTVVDLGSELLSGEGKAYGKFTFGRPDQAVSAAYFGVTKSVFRMVYPFNEQATVIVGSVVLTNEATAEKFIFTEGDSWFVEKGVPLLWEITSDYFIKHYMSSL